MNSDSLLEELDKKEDNAEQIAELVIADEKLIGNLLAGVSSKNARVRYKCAKTLRIMSEKNPQVLFPYVVFFEKLLSSRNSIIKQDAAQVLENLVVVDEEEFCRKLW